MLAKHWSKSASEQVTGWPISAAAAAASGLSAPLLAMAPHNARPKNFNWKLYI